MKKRYILLFCIFAVYLFFSIGQSYSQALKVGFVYVSPVGDAGWTYQHNIGRIQMENALKGEVTTKYIGNPEGAEVERVLRDLAKSGCGLIFATSFGYMNPVFKVAKQFPDKYFEHAIGARFVNSNIVVKVIWVNSWFDPGKEREPVKTRSGEEIVPAGSVIEDHKLKEMNFFVQGVEGSFPKNPL